MQFHHKIAPAPEQTGSFFTINNYIPMSYPKCLLYRYSSLDFQFFSWSCLKICRDAIFFFSKGAFEFRLIMEWREIKSYKIDILQKRKMYNMNMIEISSFMIIHLILVNTYFKGPAKSQLLTRITVLLIKLFLNWNPRNLKSSINGMVCCHFVVLEPKKLSPLIFFFTH